MLELYCTISRFASEAWFKFKESHEKMWLWFSKKALKQLNMTPKSGFLAMRKLTRICWQIKKRSKICFTIWYRWIREGRIVDGDFGFSPKIWIGFCSTPAQWRLGQLRWLHYRLKFCQISCGIFFTIRNDLCYWVHLIWISVSF